MIENLLGKLKIGTKLFLMVAIPTLVMLYFTVTSSISASTVATEADQIQELVELSVAIGNFVHQSQIERGRTIPFLISKGSVFPVEVANQRVKSDEQLATLRQFLDGFNKIQFGEEFQQVLDKAVVHLDQIEDVRKEVDELSIASREAATFYTDMNNALLDVVAFIPALSSNGEVADLAVAYALFLRAKDKADLERDIFDQALRADAFTHNELVQFANVVGQQQALMDAFLSIVPPEQAAIFNEIAQDEVFDEVNSMIEIGLDKGVVGRFGIEASLWFRTISQKIDLLFQVESELAQALINKTESLQQKAQINLIISTTARVGAILITIILALVISRTIIGQINSISDLFKKIGVGDYTARSEVASKDELGQMAQNLNTMLDTVLSLVQTQEERDALQTSILKLLEEVSDAAEGDLTVEAEVTTDATGAIADSFNFMIGQLREVIGNVQAATVQVSASANEIQTTAEHLSQGSEVQSTQIIDTSTAIDEMSHSIQQVSENASVSSKVAEQALINAQQGAIAVQDTIDGMNRIRNQVQETAKRITRLAESSREIGEIVQLMADIADRTSILALNASIQAAMAGEAGRGFAVVAEEVERLAERSTEASQQISNLVKTIQSETYEAATAMEESTREVVTGSTLANEAGQALGQIETVSTQLAQLIQSISHSSKQQARGSEAVAHSMNEIAEVTQQTAAGTKQAAVSINNLATLADELRSSVSTFKLPSTNGNEHRAN